MWKQIDWKPNYQTGTILVTGSRLQTLQNRQSSFEFQIENTPHENGMILENDALIYTNDFEMDEELEHEIQKDKPILDLFIKKLTYKEKQYIIDNEQYNDGIKKLINQNQYFSNE